MSDLIARLRGVFGQQDCPLCDADSVVFIRCGRGTCQRELDVRLEAATALEQRDARIAELSRQLEMCVSANHGYEALAKVLNADAKPMRAALAGLIEAIRNIDIGSRDWHEHVAKPLQAAYDLLKLTPAEIARLAENVGTEQPK